MSNEIKAIHNNLQERRVNIGVGIAGSQSSESLQKSNIIEAFTYGENKMFIDKTGAEIKAALEISKAGNEAIMATIKAKSDALLAQTTLVPADDLYDDLKISPNDVLPKRFSWDVVNAYGKANRTTVCDSVANMGNVVSEEKSSHNVLDQYNDTIRQWCRIRKENSLIGTIISGLNEKQTYKLSISQANALGL